MARGFGVTTLIQDGFEGLSVNTQTLFHSFGTDATGTLNAWTNTPPFTIASNIVTGTTTDGQAMFAGHQDWWDLTFQVRFQWLTSTTPGLIIHCDSGFVNGVLALVDGTTLWIYKRLSGGSLTSVVSVACALTNANQYWLRVQANGTTYTAIVFNDTGPGSVGSQVATTNTVIGDSILQTGLVGIRQGSTTANKYGGAFANVCTVTGPFPSGWGNNTQAGEPAYCWSKVSPFAGQYSLSIYDAHSSAHGQLAGPTTNPIVPGQVYPGQGWIKTLAGTTGVASWQANLFNSGLGYLSSRFIGSTIVGVAPWTFVSGTVIANPLEVNVGAVVDLNGVGTAYYDNVEIRSSPSLQIDDNVNSFVGEIHVPSVRDVQSASIVNRRRVARIREDTTPMEFEIRGVWADSNGATLAASKYWWDYKAALLNQVQAALDRGDGTEFRMIDVLDVAHARQGGVFAGQFGNSEVYVYTAKCLSYEPYARSKAPLLETFKDFGAAAIGTTNYTATYNYSGTAPGEPTWQWKLVLPSGCTVTSLSVQNSTTGETATSSGLTISNGTYYFLFDACGGGNIGNTPNNNSYSLLSATSNGYGATLTGTGDVDWTGNVPTLQPTRSMPPTPNANSITATCVVSGAPATSIILSLLAPVRWIR